MSNARRCCLTKLWYNRLLWSKVKQEAELYVLLWKDCQDGLPNEKTKVCNRMYHMIPIATKGNKQAKRGKAGVESFICIKHF